MEKFGFFKQKPLNKKTVFNKLRIFVSFFLTVLIAVAVFLPNYQKLPDKLSTQLAKAHYQYTATAGQINNSDGTQRYNNYEQTHAADGSTWTVSPVDITPTDTSLDIQTTIGGVDLQGANKLIISYRVSASNVSLHYVFSIYDNTTGIWRPLNNHTLFNPADATNMSNFYSQELTPAAINTFYTYQFEVFDGYFVDTTTAPGTKIDTALSRFAPSGNILLRISADDDPGTATWFMNWDFAQVEVGIDPGYAPSAANKTTGGSWSRYYSDLYTSDNAAAGTGNTYSATMPGEADAAGIRFSSSYPAYSVAYGDGKYVAVGDSGKASYSSDGIDWTSLPAGAGTGIKFGTTLADSVAYGNGKFVVVGDAGKASYSADGIDWTSLPAGAGTGIKFGTTQANSVTYGTDKFVVVGRDGMASYSADGIDWTVLTAGDATGIKFGSTVANSVIYGTDKFVVVGEFGMASYSADGIDWTVLPAGDATGIKFGLGGFPQSVTYGNSKFVVVGQNGMASYSADGIDWTVLTAGDATGIKFGTTTAYSVTYGNNKFVVVGSSSKASYSADGIDWTVLTAGTTSGIRFGTTQASYVTYGNDKFVVVGLSGKASYSVDGINWTPLGAGYGANIDFTFSNITTPAGANTLALWYEGATSITVATGCSVILYFWNYDAGVNAWEAVPVSSGNAASTTINQNLIHMFSTPVSGTGVKHISDSGEAKVKIVAFHTAAFNLYVDWLKLVVGSTNTGAEQSNVSVGAASGSLSDAGNVDSTAATPAVWTLTAATTPYPNQFYGDTSATAANYHVAADWSVPLTKPSNATITGIQQSARVNCSSATPVMALGIRDYAGGWSDFHSRAAGAAYSQTPLVVSGVSYRYQTWGSFGSATSANAVSDVMYGYNPQDYVDTTNNLMGFKIRTTTGVAAVAYTTGVDFAFLSYRYVAAEAQLTTQFTPATGVKNTGGAETNNWRFSKVNDTQYWTIAADAGAANDVDLEFQGVTAPTTWNRLIINAKYSWGTANLLHNMQIYDYANSTWRVLGGHGQATTDYLLAASGTASTQQYYQFEVFDGYFRDASASPGAAISTPVANFIGTGGDLGKVKIKIKTATVNAVLNVDWAQIELAQDFAYYPKSMTLVTGTTTNSRFYNDAYYMDNTIASGTGVHNYSYGVTKAAAGTDRLDLRINFENIDATTVTNLGFNAIFVDYSWAEAVNSRPVSLQIWNFSGGGSWETLNNSNLQNGTNNRYERYQFVKGVSTWSDYIDPSAPNAIKLRAYTTDATASAYYLDYIRIILGSVTTDTDSTASWGSTFLNDKTKTTSIDGSEYPTMNANTQNGWFVNSAPASGGRTYDSVASIAANMDFPITRPANSLVTGIRWVNRFNAPTGHTIQTQFRDYQADYLVATNAQYLGWSGAAAASSNLGYAPTALDVSQLAASSDTATTFVSGLYQYNPEDVVNTATNKINMALRTTASTSLPERNMLWDFAFVSVRYVGMNSPPSPPSLLKQYEINGVDDPEIASAGWADETTIKYTATVSDPDSDQVKICVEKKPLATPFANSEDACGSLVASGSTANVTIASQTDETEYHWQVRAQDSKGTYSTWTSFGGSPRDYGIDTVAPTGGTVYDGLAGDQRWNDGSLTILESNWLNFNPTISGINKYEYAVRRASDNYYWYPTTPEWRAAAYWYDAGLSTSATVTPVYLDTSNKYYFSVRATDNATNVSSLVNSIGQQVSPTLSFSYNTNVITFLNLNNGNNWTDTKTNTFTTSTNASSGYAIKGRITQLLTSLEDPLITIPNFQGQYSAPETWSPPGDGKTGFGYSTSDCNVNSGLFWSGPSCTPPQKFSRFSQTDSDNTVADHTEPVNGQTGAVSGETFTLTYKLAVSQSQTAATYRTYAIYIVTANY